ncbi:hypothetical protein BC739_003094 [Kutzneria viridogrisea]|uniref:PD-(D/E)XK endonuclease-like domain-containing protein n=1 Tax=Kutzneria viridogrisea TaxID=47990 RepID=A0ABR6BG92_9PSEU|nr:hypothetical protein [Kutzneria viridogrisea]
MIRDADRYAPRSQQRALGPSEVGEPCPRRLAYRLLDAERTNSDSDPWAAIVGTAVHAWLAAAFLGANDRLGRIRYLVETRLEIRPGLTGSCDLYDADEATVIDHKILGPTTMKAYSQNGPPPAYRAQAHLYGLGWTRLGVPVRDVALAFYPRSGLLSGLRVWSEPYNPGTAQAALDRHDQILALADALGCEHNPTAYQHIPRIPGHSCTYCPWLRPGPDTGTACPGHLAP